MKKQISDIVIGHDQAKQLRDGGIKTDALYAYFYDEAGTAHIFLQDENQSGLPAYTSGELIEMLPSTLEIVDYTFKATAGGWQQLFPGNGYPYAHLQTLKTDGSYMCGYYYEGGMIAFSKSDEGVYNNLLLNGDTEQEARANLLLALLEEGKL